MAKKINHRGRGGYRELLFFLRVLCALCGFPKPIPEYNKKSLFYHRGGHRVSRLREPSAHSAVESKGVTISVKIRQRPLFKYPAIQ